MSQKKDKSFIILKLAGIGDIAMACRAVDEVFSGSKDRITIHWIIDRGLSRLPSSLIQQKNIEIVTHPVHSGRLFKGNLWQKATNAFNITRHCFLNKTNAIALLHRDIRYYPMVRIGHLGKIHQIKTDPIHEITLYKQVLTKIKNDLKIETQNTNLQKTQTFEKNSLGILIGGGQGSKTIYQEKRWPHILKFIELALNQTTFKIILFGSKEDSEAAATIVKHFNTNRITDQVGQTALEDLPVSIKNLQYFISPDSGLAHIASNVMSDANQKIIVLFGPTDPKLWAPVGISNNVRVLYENEKCSPCYKNDGNFKACIYTGENFSICMKKISPENVLDVLN